MQMRYFGHKRTNWLCSGPRACSKKPLYSRDTWAVLSLARRVTAWWMIAKGGSRGHAARAGLTWRNHGIYMHWLCALVSFPFLCFCSCGWGAQTRELWKVADLRASLYSVAFDRWWLTAHCLLFCCFFSEAKIWHFKSCLKPTLLDLHWEIHAHTKSHLTHGSQWLSCECDRISMTLVKPYQKPHEYKL